MSRLNVLHFICPTGMYGAERWILALNRNLDSAIVNSRIVIPLESERQKDVVKQFEDSGQSILSFEANSSLGIIRCLCRLVREHDIQVIHTHGYKSDILGLVAARKTGIRALSTPHGFGEPGDLKLKIYIGLGKFCLRFFDAISPLSTQLVDDVVGAGVPPTKIVFIRNAVDIDEIQSHRKASSRNRPDGRRVIGYIGQLIPRKKIDHIIDIFNQIWSQNDQVDLQILGEGTSREDLEAYAKSLPAAAAIRFYGYREDRLDFLANFDLFVMTSSDEGIPRCMMEAIAMGIPVAAYDIEGVDQLVEHQHTGLLADYGNKAALKGCWEKLLYDKEQAKTMAERGRNQLAEKYSAKRMAEEYTDLYRSLLSSG